MGLGVCTVIEERQDGGNCADIEERVAGTGRDNRSVVESGGEARPMFLRRQEDLANLHHTDGPLPLRLDPLLSSSLLQAPFVNPFTPFSSPRRPFIPEISSWLPGSVPTKPCGVGGAGRFLKTLPRALSISTNGQEGRICTLDAQRRCPVGLETPPSAS